MQKSALTIIGVSGAGANLLTKFMSTHKEEEGKALIKPIVLDTSNDFKQKGVDIPFYKIETGLDGAGGERLNTQAAVGPTRSIMYNLNTSRVVIICDTSGGSGGTVMLAAVMALMERGVPVSVLAVSKQDNILETTNAINVIESLDNVVRDAGKTINVKIVNNSVRATADKVIIDYLNALTILCSGQLLEIDSVDVDNFIEQSRYTTIETIPKGLLSYNLSTGTAADVTASRAVLKEIGSEKPLHGDSKKTGYYRKGVDGEDFILSTNTTTLGSFLKDSRLRLIDYKNAKVKNNDLGTKGGTGIQF